MLGSHWRPLIVPLSRLTLMPNCGRLPVYAPAQAAAGRAYRFRPVACSATKACRAPLPRRSRKALSVRRRRSLAVQGERVELRAPGSGSEPAVGQVVGPVLVLRRLKGLPPAGILSSVNGGS